MKIRLNQELTNVDGKTFIKDKDQTVTLKDICIRALLTPIEKDTMKLKLEKWDIFKKIRDASHDVSELKSEEITIIKEAMGVFEPQLILGQCIEMLENSK
jgi:hypothetical protein